MFKNKGRIAFSHTVFVFVNFYFFLNLHFAEVQIPCCGPWDIPLPAAGGYGPDLEWVGFLGSGRQQGRCLYVRIPIAVPGTPAWCSAWMRMLFINAILLQACVFL